MKGLFCSDLHLRFLRPRRRVDDFLEALLGKLAEVLALAREHKATIVLFGGDFFDSCEPSLYVLNRAQDLLRSQQANIPIYAAVGQHDVEGYNMEMLHRTGLGNLIKTSAVFRLDLLEMDDVVIKGMDYMLTGDVVYTFPVKFKDKFKIIVSHNTIVPKPLPYTHRLVADLKTNADIVFCGDYHQPFEAACGRTRYINAGSLARMSKDDIDRNNISVIVFDTAAGKTEKVNLKSAKPATEIFDLQGILADKAAETEISQFLAQLQQTGDFDEGDLATAVKMEAQEQGLEPEILEDILKRLTLYKNKEE